jgi:hypothetical protein
VTVSGHLDPAHDPPRLCIEFDASLPVRCDPAVGVPVADSLPSEVDRLAQAGEVHVRGMFQHGVLQTEEVAAPSG